MPRAGPQSVRIELWMRQKKARVHRAGLWRLVRIEGYENLLTGF